jgi:hypothetical protein
MPAVNPGSKSSELGPRIIRKVIRNLARFFLLKHKNNEFLAIHNGQPIDGAAGGGTLTAEPNQGSRLAGRMSSTIIR